MASEKATNFKHNLIEVSLRPQKYSDIRARRLSILRFVFSFATK